MQVPRGVCVCKEVSPSGTGLCRGGPGGGLQERYLAPCALVLPLPKGRGKRRGGRLKSMGLYPFLTGRGVGPRCFPTDARRPKPAPPWMQRWVACIRVMDNILFTYLQVRENSSFQFFARRLAMHLSFASALTQRRPCTKETKGMKFLRLFKHAFRSIIHGFGLEGDGVSIHDTHIVNTIRPQIPRSLDQQVPPPPRTARPVKILGLLRTCMWVKAFPARSATPSQSLL